MHISSSGLTCLVLLIPLDSLCEDLNCTVNILFVTVHCHQRRHLQTFKSSIWQIFMQIVCSQCQQLNDGISQKQSQWELSALSLRNSCGKGQDTQARSSYPSPSQRNIPTIFLLRYKPKIAFTEGTFLSWHFICLSQDSVSLENLFHPPFSVIRAMKKEINTEEMIRIPSICQPPSHK